MAELALQTVLRIKTTECITCGCVIGMSAEMYDWRLRDHSRYYCPNGHYQNFVGESDVAKAQRELREERERHQRTLTLKNGADESLRRADAAKVRLQRRIKAGTCPCCKRTFKQLAAHMHAKHPEFTKEPK